MISHLAGNILDIVHEYNPYQGELPCYDHYLADLVKVLDSVVYPRHVAPLMIMAHSMGAHITLHYLSRFPHKTAKGSRKNNFTFYTSHLQATFTRSMAAKILEIACYSCGFGCHGSPESDLNLSA